MAPIDAIAFMDRRLRTGAVGLTAVYAGGVTTWTLPYAVAVDGSEGDLRVASESTRALLVSTRPTETTIAVAGSDLSNSAVVIGTLYPFTYVPSKVFLRDAKGQPDLTSKLTLHHLVAKFAETISIGSTVVRKGRAVPSKLLKTFPAPKSSELSIPIHADREDVQITITDYSPAACVLAGLTWSGTKRSPVGQRV